jgi:NhaP-type Na+/H+ or K+/H+ antiporter
VRGFETAMLVFGLALLAGALLAGLAHRSLLSLTALFVVAGFALGRGGLDVLRFSAGSGFVHQLALVALVVILFRDGLEVDAEMLQREWHAPLRNLVLAMPITAGIVAVVAHAATGLSWTEAFLVGALLSPTDPVLSSGVVTDPRVPRLIRHTLNLESGMNDGLALPAVLALTAALASRSHFVWWRFVLEDVSLGLAFGLLGGIAASLLMPRGERLDRSVPAHHRALMALGAGFAIYGGVALSPHGNALIAVFVGAITLGIRRPDVRVYFAERAGELVEIVKLGIFIVFGSLLTIHGVLGDGWGAVAIVAATFLLARPIAVLVALLGTRTNVEERAFMAWFGPKGVATITFSLVVLSSAARSGARIFNIAALAVFCSIIAHGVSDTPAVTWLARRERRAASRAAAGGAGVTRTARPDPEPTETPTPPGSAAPGET